MQRLGVGIHIIIEVARSFKKLEIIYMEFQYFKFSTILNFSANNAFQVISNPHVHPCNLHNFLQISPPIISNFQNQTNSNDNQNDHMNDKWTELLKQIWTTRRNPEVHKASCIDDAGDMKG